MIVPLALLVEVLRDIEHSSYGLLSWNCHHFSEDTASFRQGQLDAMRHDALPMQPLSSDMLSTSITSRYVQAHRSQNVIVVAGLNPIHASVGTWCHRHQSRH